MTLLGESLDLIPSHTLHRRFAATGRAAPSPSVPPLNEVVFVSSSGSTSTSTYHGVPGTAPNVHTYPGFMATGIFTVATAASSIYDVTEAALSLSVDLGWIPLNTAPLTVTIAGVTGRYVDPRRIQLSVAPFQNLAGWVRGVNAATTPPKREAQEGRLEDFLEQVYILVEVADIQGATDRIFNYIDRLLCDGQFYVCDELLKRVDIESLPTTLMRSFLTITAPAKDKLPSRKPLYEKIERKMVEVRGERATARLIGRLV